MRAKLLSVGNVQKVPIDLHIKKHNSNAGAVPQPYRGKEQRTSKTRKNAATNMQQTLLHGFLLLFEDTNTWMRILSAVDFTVANHRLARVLREKPGKDNTSYFFSLKNMCYRYLCAHTFNNGVHLHGFEHLGMRVKRLVCLDKTVATSELDLVCRKSSRAHRYSCIESEVSNSRTGFNPNGTVGAVYLGSGTPLTVSNRCLGHEFGEILRQVVGNRRVL